MIFSEPKGSVYTGELASFDKIGAAVAYDRGLYGVIPDVRTLPKVAGVTVPDANKFMPFTMSETVTHYGSNIDVGDKLDEASAYTTFPTATDGPLCTRPWMFKRGYAGNVQIRFRSSSDCYFKTNLTSSLTYGLYFVPILATKYYLYIAKLATAYTQVRSDASDSTKGRHVVDFDMILYDVPHDTPVVGLMPYYNSSGAENFIGGGTNPRHYYAQYGGTSEVSVTGSPVIDCSPLADPWSGYTSTDLNRFAYLSGLAVWKSTNFGGLQESTQNLTGQVWYLPA